MSRGATKKQLTDKTNNDYSKTPQIIDLGGNQTHDTFRNVRQRAALRGLTKSVYHI